MYLSSPQPWMYLSDKTAKPTTATPVMAVSTGYDPTSIHQSESVYSTPLSSLMGLDEKNKYIHSLPSLPHSVEFLVFLFGYAFNPVSIPLWMIVVSLTGVVIPNGIEANNSERQSYYYPSIFYFATVLVTLIGTEICKASFRATRPEALLSSGFLSSKVRRYGTLVASLKSKHSFPSGDSAQAANAVLFWYFFVSPLWQEQKPKITTMIHLFAFLMFYPGVAFARIFYHCHWIEDCLGGAILAAFLHRTVIPSVAFGIWEAIQKFATF
jgi:membrane-associated phospholipid phosphatase